MCSKGGMITEMCQIAYNGTFVDSSCHSPRRLLPQDQVPTFRRSMKIFMGPQPPTHTHTHTHSQNAHLWPLSGTHPYSSFTTLFVFVECTMGFIKMINLHQLWFSGIQNAMNPYLFSPSFAF